MSEKIVLVDGHSILNRAFYGVPHLSNSKGLPTNAVYGFLSILFHILEEEQPQYLAVAFDMKAPTFRHIRYPEYKGTRKPMPEELREQVPIMKEMLEAMEVPLMMLEGYEADDLLGTVSRQMEAAGLQVVIVSGDRDLLQLATDHIQIRMPKTNRTGTVVENYYAADVKEKYQVTPPQIIELKALMGDASDNIPGIPGVGEKTATKLIIEYGNIENAYAHVEEIKPNKARESLREHYDLAVLSKELATINTQSPFTLDLEQAKIKNLYTQKAFELCRRLELKKFFPRFAGMESEEKTALSCTRCRELSETEAVFASLDGQKSLGFFLVTEGKRLLGAALAVPGGRAWMIEVSGFVTEAYLEEKLLALLDGCAEAVTCGLKEQLAFLEGCPQEHVEDVAIGAYLLNPLKDSYQADDLARDYLDEGVSPLSALVGKLTLGQAMETEREKAVSYSCSVADIAVRSWPVIRERLESEGMGQLYREIEMPLVFTLADMEKEGILVQAEELAEYGSRLVGRIAELEEEIYALAGEAFNIQSPKQLGVILFEKLGMPGGKKTKTGYSTAADVLERLAGEYPIVNKILEYRQLTKLKSTYADGLAAFIAEDGRIHTSFNQTITATGRLSSTEPNLQNIPIRMELGRLIRKVFVPKAGAKFIDADYSQIELRVLAHISGDEQLIEAYREAQDIHRMTASQVFHVPFDEVTELQRRNAKAVNFGIVYGISSFGLSQDLSITRKEAQDYIEQYFHTYPKIKEFLDRTVEQAKRDGYVTSLYGRKRPVPELSSSNFMQRSFGERVAMNSPIQGTAADIIKIAMNRVRKRLEAEGLKSRLILQVHDELLIEAEENELEQVERLLREEMQHAAELSVPLEVDVHTGNNWYEAK